MKSNELHGMSDEQLGLTIRDIEKHLFQLRFQSATDRLETPSEIRKAKRDIARVKSEQRRRELAALPKISDEVLAKGIADWSAKTDGPGKRRAKRAVARLTALHETRLQAKSVAATKTK